MYHISVNLAFGRREKIFGHTKLQGAEKRLVSTFLVYFSIFQTLKIQRGRPKTVLYRFVKE